jgi:hypothetical protein
MSPICYIAGRPLKLRARCKARYTNPVRSLPICAATGKRVKEVNRNWYYYFAAMIKSIWEITLSKFLCIAGSLAIVLLRRDETASTPFLV